MVKEIKEKDFYDVIKQGKVLVDCYANWCGPCKMLSPVLEEISNEVTNYNFYKLDVDTAPNVASEYNIMSIPALFVFNNGELIDTIIGLRSKENIKEFLK